MFFLFFRIKELHWLKKNTLDKAETFIELESLVSSFASYSVCASNVTFNKTLHQHLVIRIKNFKEKFVKSTWFSIIWLLTTLISRKKRWNSLGFFVFRSLFKNVLIWREKMHWENRGNEQWSKWNWIRTIVRLWSMRHEKLYGLRLCRILLLLPSNFWR